MTAALPNPFAAMRVPSAGELDEQIATATDLLVSALAKAETGEQHAEICLIEAEYLVPLLRQREAIQER